MEFKHIPVLFNESIEALDIKPDGLYADCTAGGGGHSNAILDRLSANGRLVAIDRDPEAIETLTKRFEGRENVSIVNDNFFNIKSILSQFTDEGANHLTNANRFDEATTFYRRALERDPENISYLTALTSNLANTVARCSKVPIITSSALARLPSPL